MRFVVTLAFLLAAACATEAQAPRELRAPVAVTGMITAIERSDRGPITAFTVDVDGEAYDIRIDPSRDYGFDLEHLEEHRLQELPVRVTLEERGDRLYAVDILDA